jgi:hypothetical protein
MLGRPAKVQRTANASSDCNAFGCKRIPKFSVTSKIDLEGGVPLTGQYPWGREVAVDTPKIVILDTDCNYHGNDDG